MVFNHDAKSATQSMGVKDGMDERIAELMVKIVDKGKQKFSHVAEEIHNELSYEDILFLAAHEAISALKVATTEAILETVQETLQEHTTSKTEGEE
jgi:ABC-type transport system involved in Fe-S cluster assembly fused permease/ATPase subunit